jgi:hypothetical protein
MCSWDSPSVISLFIGVYASNFDKRMLRLLFLRKNEGSCSWLSIPKQTIYSLCYDTYFAGSSPSRGLVFL